MSLIRVFIFSLSALLIVSCPAVAAQPKNGPVSITVNSTAYSIYYTTVPYSSIVANGTPLSSTSKGSTSSPNLLPGVQSAQPLFMQPWWNPTNTTAAQNAALAWYNAGSYPNQATQFPNSTSTRTPYFAYSTDETGSFVNYAYVNNSGVVNTGQSLVTETLSFAVAGVSN